MSARPAPHWSDTIAWRAGRWDPMANAPHGRPIRIRTESGAMFEPVAFKWRAWRWLSSPLGPRDQLSVTPWEWQPLHADQRELVWPFPTTETIRAILARKEHA